MAKPQAKPAIAVHKFSSCDGCQLLFLSLEEELLQLANRTEIAFFAEATSRMEAGPYDISFCEGSISTPHEVERIRHIRAISKIVVGIGACAMAGGLQALRNWGDIHYYLNTSYPNPEHVGVLPDATPFHDHVAVDWEVPGCPPNQDQLKFVITTLLAGAQPHLPTEAVCIKCKREGNVCILVTQDRPCMGPITRTGCGALCPHQQRDCYSCFGPQGGPNIDAMGRRLLGAGLRTGDVVRRLRLIYSWHPTFRHASEKWLQSGTESAPLPPDSPLPPYPGGGEKP